MNTEPEPVEAELQLLRDSILEESNSSVLSRDVDFE